MVTGVLVLCRNALGQTPHDFDNFPLPTHHLAHLCSLRFQFLLGLRGLSFQLPLDLRVLHFELLFRDRDAVVGRVVMRYEGPYLLGGLGDCLLQTFLVRNLLFALLLKILCHRAYLVGSLRDGGLHLFLACTMLFAQCSDMYSILLCDSLNFG